MNAPRPERIRIRFAKFGRVRFISHRDVARVWERSLRRTRLPISYSEGYSPRPRIRFGLALSTSHESCGEYLDVDLVPGSAPDVAALGGLLSETLPPGMVVQAVGHVPPGTPSLQEAVELCSWLFEVEQLDDAGAHALVEQVEAATELPVTRTRKGKTVVDDVRPSVVTIRVADPTECPTVADWPRTGALLHAELATQPRSCRPGDVLGAIDASLIERRAVRLHQWTNTADERREPLAVDPDLVGSTIRDTLAPSADRARQARAS